VADVIGGDYPGVEYLASIDEGDYLSTPQFRPREVEGDRLVLTFDRLLQEQGFISLIKSILQRLEQAYGCPVDIEFALELLPKTPHPNFVVHILQCRPLSSWTDSLVHEIPSYIPEQDVIFTATRLVPDGIVPRVEYVVYVDPRSYGKIADQARKYEIGRLVGRLNKRLEGKHFILIGPGRWGTSNIDLGVKVTYADIYNTSMLVEVAFTGASGTPELSYGTHFFQDLVEANIHPLSLYPDDEETVFNERFFYDAPNALVDLLPDDAAYADVVRVIDVPAATGGRYLEVVMNAEEEQALGYVR
jgi:hypothetical protein